MSAFACPECGKDGFATYQAMRSHQVVHRTTKCGLCRKSFSTKAIGWHRKNCGEAKPPSPDRTVLGAVLDELGIIPTIADRIERFVDELGASPTGYVVAGITWGPYRTNAVSVGSVIANARQGCIVVDLDVLQDVIRRRRVLGDAA